jgi:hypothetical protein
MSNYTKEASRMNSLRRSYQYFNGSTSELYEMWANFSKQSSTNSKSFWLIQLSDITNYKAGRMVNNVANYLPHFRSFVIGMLKGGLGFIKCKSYKAAKRYSNLGGEVVMVRNLGGAVVWGVVK